MYLNTNIIDIDCLNNNNHIDHRRSDISLYGSCFAACYYFSVVPMLVVHVLATPCTNSLVILCYGLTTISITTTITIDLKSPSSLTPPSLPHQCSKKSSPSVYSSSSSPSYSYYFLLVILIVTTSNYNRANDVAVYAGVWQHTPKTADVTVTEIAGYVRVRILMNR